MCLDLGHPLLVLGQPLLSTSYPPSPCDPPNKIEDSCDRNHGYLALLFLARHWRSPPPRKTCDSVCLCLSRTQCPPSRGLQNQTSTRTGPQSGPWSRAARTDSSNKELLSRWATETGQPRRGPKTVSRAPSERLGRFSILGKSCSHRALRSSPRQCRFSEIRQILQRFGSVTFFSIKIRSNLAKKIMIFFWPNFDLGRKR